jgi:hypothetical protein
MTGRVSGVLKALGLWDMGHDQRAQIFALDEQFAAMENEITTLKADNLKLKGENAPLERDIEGLKKKLELKEGLHSSEHEETILSVLCHVQKALSIMQISEATKLSRYRVEHFLTKLMERGLVRRVPHWQGGVLYGPSDDGQAYGVEQGWI